MSSLFTCAYDELSSDNYPGKKCGEFYSVDLINNYESPILLSIFQSVGIISLFTS